MALEEGVPERRECGLVEAVWTDQGRIWNRGVALEAEAMPGDSDAILTTFLTAGRWVCCDPHTTLATWQGIEDAGGCQLGVR
jgi:hypothetical protein